MSGLLATLFQPNKGHLSPAGRAFVSWLEIVILGILASAAAVGLNYINGNPGDYQGLLKIIVASLVISVLKAFSGLSIPRATTPTFSPIVQPAQSVQVPQTVFSNTVTSTAPQTVQPAQFVQPAPQAFAFAPTTTYPTLPVAPQQ